MAGRFPESGSYLSLLTMIFKNSMTLVISLSESISCKISIQMNKY